MFLLWHKSVLHFLGCCGDRRKKWNLCELHKLLKYDVGKEKRKLHQSNARWSESDGFQINWWWETGKQNQKRKNVHISIWDGNFDYMYISFFPLKVDVTQRLVSRRWLTTPLTQTNPCIPSLGFGFLLILWHLLLQFHPLSVGSWQFCQISGSHLWPFFLFQLIHLELTVLSLTPFLPCLNHVFLFTLWDIIQRKIRGYVTLPYKNLYFFQIFIQIFIFLSHFIQVVVTLWHKWRWPMTAEAL